MGNRQRLKPDAPKIFFWGWVVKGFFGILWDSFKRFFYCRKKLLCYTAFHQMRISLTFQRRRPLSFIFDSATRCRRLI
jgi:hypothetical protein